ncbi:23S rRNA (pseudouridine(1915)-N(3))-methyltransferase RlmH [Flavobacteriales bacterium]|nr:23S rRNA (pseudouridine(1915)-N(3))-methyltransferase RlmH [Flavobacteriales bacterium]
MKIVLLTLGKTSQKNIKEEILLYIKRLSHYTDFELLEIPSLKSSKKLNQSELKKSEGQMIMKSFNNSDYVVLLDENGKSYSSIDFSKKIEKFRLNSFKRVVFVVGGAFGFSDELYSYCNEKLSLSNMTFSHQMVRLFFIEQLYRAFTIINNEKYHHQ